MLNPEDLEFIQDWQKKAGGHNKVPAAHGLKVLGEVVKLCYAMGANEAQILDVVDEEIHKEVAKWVVPQSCIHDFDAKRTTDKVGTVLVCLGIIITHYALPSNLLNTAREKVQSRKWVADKDGVLRM